MNDETLSIGRSFTIFLRILAVGWQIRSRAVIGYFIGALIEISGMLVSIFATAKLGALLAGFITTGRTDYIWFWLIIGVVASAWSGLGFLAMNYAKRMIYFAFVGWDINTFLSTVCHMDIADFYDPKLRNQLNKVGATYIWQLPNLSDACLDLLYGILRFIAITIVVAQITWWLVPLIALFLLPTLIGESRMAKMQWFVWDSKGDFRHIFWGLEYIIKQAKGQMELRSTQATNFVLSKIDQMNASFYREQEKKYSDASKALIGTRIMEVFGTAIGSVVVLKQFLNHTISLERYFFLSGALFRIGGALNNIFGTLSRMQESLLFAHSYFQLAESAPKLTDKQDAVLLPKAQVPTILFKDVSFVYPGQTEPVVENLNLEIKAGEHVALVGENGAGKTTIIKLLLRFYQPTTGEILVNGKNINDINIESWYAQLATLFQDFNHYPLTIAENIEIGRSGEKPDAKMLKKAATFGSVDRMVKDYEHGWDTVLDSSFKKGIEPSGGQWQRVALARAFYRNANMIILDEPTSAIDAKAEYEIFNNIFNHYDNKTALIVSHRFSTVRRANRIVVLDRGNIMEQGTHQELLENKGIYHEMFTKQAEGYR